MVNITKAVMKINILTDKNEGRLESQFIEIQSVINNPTCTVPSICAGVSRVFPTKKTGFVETPYKRVG